MIRWRASRSTISTFICLRRRRSVGAGRSHMSKPSTTTSRLVVILAYGGSNWSHARIAKANEYAATHGLAPFIASSPNFTLAVQNCPPWDGCVSISAADQAPAREYYGQLQMPLFTWSSSAGGFFSARLRRDNVEYFRDVSRQVGCHGLRQR
jgi:aryl-alcohol dehydrogenase-like predicted oxidoreductase